MGITVNTIKAAANGMHSPKNSPQQRATEETKRNLLRESTTPSGAKNLGSSVTPSAELLLDLHAQLGESPTWDARTERLWFVDINSKKIYCCREDGTDLFSIDTPETVGTIALTTDENILLAAMNRSVFTVDIAKRSIGTAIATVPEEHGIEDLRFNDGKASPGGAFIVGRMHMQCMKGEPGRLYRLHWESPEEGWFEEIQGTDVVGLPNGLAWDSDVMYHADTFHRTITSFKTDSVGVPKKSADGTIKGDVVIRVPEEFGGGPDGMSITREGYLWVAVPSSGSIACYSPKDGREIARVPLPIKNPTCTVFGGSKLSKLYITSMKEEGPDASEHWGGVFVVDVPGDFGLAPGYKVQIPS